MGPAKDAVFVRRFKKVFGVSPGVSHNMVAEAKEAIVLAVLEEKFAHIREAHDARMERLKAQIDTAVAEGHLDEARKKVAQLEREAKWDNDPAKEEFKKLFALAMNGGILLPRHAAGFHFDPQDAVTF